eukprot:365387-Chlamydomonas_euryale.AAC.24
MPALAARLGMHGMHGWLPESADWLVVRGLATLLDGRAQWHGLSAWLVCMACLHGLSAWLVCMACLHGLSAWLVCMACLRSLDAVSAWAILSNLRWARQQRL